MVLLQQIPLLVMYPQFEDGARGVEHTSQKNYLIGLLIFEQAFLFYKLLNNKEYNEVDEVGHVSLGTYNDLK